MDKHFMATVALIDSCKGYWILPLFIHISLSRIWTISLNWFFFVFLYMFHYLDLEIRVMMTLTFSEALYICARDIIINNALKKVHKYLLFAQSIFKVAPRTRLKNIIHLIRELIISHFCLLTYLNKEFGLNKSLAQEKIGASYKLYHGK